jgi:hypothetical protein
LVQGILEDIQKKINEVAPEFGQREDSSNLSCLGTMGLVVFSCAPDVDGRWFVVV